MMSLLDPGSVSRFHLSENVLTRLVSQELSWMRRFLAKRHLNSCSKCLAKYDRRVRTVFDMIEHRQTVVARIGRLPSARRDSFIRQLDAELASTRRPWWKQLRPRPKIRAIASPVPALTGALTVVAAGIVMLSVLRWPVPPVSAAEFLNRAVVADRDSATSSGSGVVRRRVLVKTKHETIEHAIYRDASGRRRPPKYAKFAVDELDLTARLALAGVSWDDPLSAVSFKSWHDRQTHPIDTIQSSGPGLLTMSTRLLSTNIVQESLTVKEESFHPIKRTVEDLAFGTIEISEVGEDVLSGENAKELFLEAQPNTSTAVRPIPEPVLLPSTAQLSETELKARLMLNRMSADTGEQIEITRDDRQVRVNGLVESDQRKRELSESLQTLPFLAVKIASFDDLKSASTPASQSTPTHSQTSVSQVSPLEDYLVEHGRGRDLSRISAGLFNCSLAINRSSRSIEQIALRFSANQDLSPGAIRARDELLSRKVDTLLDDLKQQQQFLDEAGVTLESTANPANAQPNIVDMAHLAERNTAATKWLISSPAEYGRSEMLQAKAAELAETISQLRSVASSIRSHAKPEEH